MLEKIIAFFMAIIAFFANLFGISIPGVTEPADSKIIAFFMAIIAFFANLFGISIPGVTEPADSGSYIYADAAYGDEERQILDLYIPKESDGTIGLVLMIHGGAWIAGDKNAYGADMLRYVSEDVGLAAAAINYRYLSETVNLHDIIDDIDLALQFIKEKGEENGVTIDKAMLTGTSAGAHLSLLYAYSMKDTAPITPACVVSYCGPTDLALLLRQQYGRYGLCMPADELRLRQILHH